MWNIPVSESWTTEPGGDLQSVDSDKYTSEGQENYKQLKSEPVSANGGIQAEYHVESDAVRRGFGNE